MLTEQPVALGRLERAATAGVGFLAAGSFALSYDALHQIAAANHVPKPLAWVWPLIVDGFIVTASLSVLHAIRTYRSAAYPWMLVLSFSITSVVFNVLNAPPALVARLVAAIPPLTLVLSFELLMRQLRHQLVMRAHVETAAGTRPQLPPPTREPAAPLIALGNEKGSLRQRAQELRRQHDEAGRRLTGKALAGSLAISDGYARRLLREMSPSTVPYAPDIS